MYRREFNSTAWAVLSAFSATPVATFALGLNDLSQGDASSGLKAVLEKGAVIAVDLLGKEGGFLNEPKVRIGLPGHLEEGAKLLKSLGQGRRVEELIVAMNHAAEQAVPMAKELLVSAVKTMTVADARQILAGGDTAGTDFFASKTREPLAARFLPEVTRATEKVALADKYNQFAGKAASFGLIRKDDAHLSTYVTGRALDGLFLVMAEQERRFRQNPAAAGSAVIERVLGVLKR